MSCTSGLALEVPVVAVDLERVLMKERNLHGNDCDGIAVTITEWPRRVSMPQCE